jgi:hypothetical protein
LAFVVKEGENIYYLSPCDINPSVLLAYCEAIIDFQQNFNTYMMNLYPLGESNHIIEELEQIAYECRNGIEEGVEKNEVDEDCILLSLFFK